MKRRDPQAERERWSTHQLFRRGFRMRRVRAWLTGAVLGALSFGAAVVLAVLVYGPNASVAGGW